MKHTDNKNKRKSLPLIGVVMGSKSDYDTMNHAIQILEQFKAPYEAMVISAHRTPDRMFEYAEKAYERGLKCLIAGAGGAAHLPGMLASKTSIPVLGVPIVSSSLSGVDSLLSIVQMPKGVPVATFAIGESGAVNAGLFAIAMLSNENLKLKNQLEKFRINQSKASAAQQLPKHLTKN